MPQVAFVMEQALGHITHTENVRSALREHPEVSASWAIIDFRVTGWARRIPLYRSNWTVRAGLRTRRELRRLARTTRLEAAYFHTQVPAVLAGRWLRRLPSVVSVDATPRQYDQLGEAYGHHPGPAWLERVKWRLNRDCFRRAERVVAFSDWVKQGLVDDYEVAPDKIEVIRPGIDLDRWQVPDRRRTPGSGPLRVLFVGGDFRRKGGPLLLAAFEALRDLDVELHVVTRQEVPTVPGCIVHTGVSPNSPELHALFEQADVFCLPTDGDALALVFVEAGASGLPCVATDVGAITEVVRQGETGTVIQPGDLDGLVGALRELLTDDDLRERYGRAARGQAEADYDDRANTRRIVELCELVAGSR
jgi:glycosyltransferase involved in cell wall biosynthesis